VNRPPFEVADIIRQHQNSFIEKNRSWLTWQHVRVLHAIGALPHVRAGRPSRSLFPMRSSRHLLQLLPYGEFFLMGSSALESAQVGLFGQGWAGGDSP
jgi:hypothetical protein